MKDVLAIYPRNYGYIRTSLPEILFRSLRKECSELEESDRHVTGLTKYYLNTSDQYKLKNENKDSLFEFVKKLIGVYENNFDYIGNINVLDASLPYVFGDPWVNVQKNYQHIPIHVHDGVYSYTCWIDLPPSSLFEFLYPSIIGAHVREEINLTPEDRGGILLFPSGLLHTVHPFEGDDKRVSISGNILLGTK